MFSSAATLGATQVARAATLPTASHEPLGKRAFLEGVRQRNTMLDAIFYDVGKVSGEEAEKISIWLAAEGAILLVPPSSQGDLVLCRNADELAARAGAAAIGALAVAGVGSSALGSAAFARNVADAIDAPVIAVVSGYGLADLLTEAMGGFFWFGALNGLRHSFEGLDARSTSASSLDVTLSTGDDLLLRTSRDTATVLTLLSDARFDIPLLVGHSKGNLVISEALYALVRRDPARAGQVIDAARIVTVSARIAMPPRCKDVIDVMGGLDWFGDLNSRPFLDADKVVPGAWHHTNTELPMHVPVTAVLREVLGARRHA